MTSAYVKVCYDKRLRFTPRQRLELIAAIIAEFITSPTMATPSLFWKGFWPPLCFRRMVFWHPLSRASFEDEELDEYCSDSLPDTDSESVDDSATEESEAIVKTYQFVLGQSCLKEMPTQQHKSRGTCVHAWVRLLAATNMACVHVWAGPHVACMHVMASP